MIVFSNLHVRMATVFSVCPLEPVLTPLPRLFRLRLQLEPDGDDPVLRLSFISSSPLSFYVSRPSRLKSFVSLFFRRRNVGCALPCAYPSAPLPVHCPRIPLCCDAFLNGCFFLDYFKGLVLRFSRCRAIVPFVSFSSLIRVTLSCAFKKQPPFEIGSRPRLFIRR